MNEKINEFAQQFLNENPDYTFSINKGCYLNEYKLTYNKCEYVLLISNTRPKECHYIESNSIIMPQIWSLFNKILKEHGVEV